MAEKIIQNPSLTPDDFTYDPQTNYISAIAGHPLAGNGGGTIEKSDLMWKPEVGDDGYVRWELTTSATTPEAAYISGAQGPAGQDGAQGEPGEDACPITATSAEIDDGVHVTISYTSGGDALTEFDILDGYDGNDGKTPEFSTNPVNAHLLWKYSGDSNWIDFGFAMSGETGPQGPEGPEGPSGISPTVTTATIAGGNRVIFTYGEGSTTSIDVMSGVSGLPGVSPTVTVTNIPADPLAQEHKNGGTEITIIDATTTNKFSAWNGNDGTMAGAPDIKGKNGISAVLDGSIYEVGLSADYLALVQSVSSKLTKTSADTLYQSIGNYVSSTEIADMATQTWVGNQGFLTEVPNTYALKSEIPTKVTDLTDSADYAKKTDLEGFVTSSSQVITGEKQYALTTAGWAEVQAGSTFDGVITDTTLTGDGTDSSHKLGVAWSALSGNLINSAKSANSAEYITNGTGYSGFNDISAKFDSLTSYIPFTAISLPIGTSNTVTDYSMGIGYSNTANYGDDSTPVQYGSLAFGYQNSASKMSFAAGNGNNALYVGFAVGYHCTATEHAVAMNNVCSANDFSFAEGNENKANKYSFAGGYKCIADEHSFAYGDTTSAIGKSFAYGPANSAYNYSHLIGRGLEYSGASTAGYNLGAFVIGGWNATTSYATTADAPLFIIGNGSTENNRRDAFVVYRNGAVRAGSATSANESNSVAFGSLSQASGNCAFVAGAWCYAIGQGAHAEGNSCGTTGYGNHIQGSFNLFESTGTAYNGPGNTPVFVGGTLNATTAQDYSDHGGYLQIMGNGTYQSQGTGIRSDAYILYRDGTVSAKQYKVEGYTQNNTYVEASVPKSLPNTGDNTMVVQKMFVCSSDSDIVAHAALADGEGCIFFRVG